MTQREALDILKTGRNVFLTGAAGSGKTYVLREYIKYLRDIGADVGITASTGIAATHMGGTTIHSWSGIGINDTLDRGELAMIADKNHIKRNVKNASILIIDEISMLHHFRLDLVDRVLREVRGEDMPFGGLQTIFCGDFFQLPPVRRGNEEVFFAYHSKVWKDLGLKICYLEEQHRQNDTEYLKILNAIRGNNISKDVVDMLEGRFDAKSVDDSTRLYSHNRNVDSENDMELEKIKGRAVEYQMMERGRPSIVAGLKKSCLAPEILRLKEGAKVMFVKNNFEEGYVNGTLGVVTKCFPDSIKVRTKSGLDIDVEQASWVIEEDGKIRAEIVQYPLRLAWAITIHKSQGMSLDSALIDLSQSFEKGMGYVALSRVRSLEGLALIGLNQKALEVSDEVLEFDKKFREHSRTNSFHIKTMGEEKLDKMHDEFREKVGGKKVKHKKLDTKLETKMLLDGGFGVKEIAKMRGLKEDTIFDHIEELKEGDPKFNIYHLRNGMPKAKYQKIYSAFQKVGVEAGGQRRLAPVKELLGPKFSYTDLRLVRLFL